MARSFKIGLQYFETQKQTMQHFQAILHGNAPGLPLDKQSTAELLDLLQYHPERDVKIGIGVSHFTVQPDGWGKFGFYIHRIDGSGTDFSFIACIKGPPTSKAMLSSAFRRVVAADILALRDSLFNLLGDADRRLPCAVTGELLSAKEGHMDHRPPRTFDALMCDFLKLKGMHFKDVPLKAPADNQTIYELSDAALGEEFRLYHNENAEIDFVSVKTNLSRK